MLRTELRKGINKLKMSNQQLDIKEFWHKIGKIESDVINVQNDLNAMNVKLDIIANLSERVSRLETSALDRKDRLRRVEENQAKIVWLVISSIISGIIGFIFFGGMKK